MDEPRLSVADAVLLRETVSAMTEDQVWRTLEALANRELGLLDNPLIGGDPEMRQAAMWNAAAMVAAAERFITRVRDDGPLPEPGPSQQSSPSSPNCGLSASEEEPSP